VSSYVLVHGAWASAWVWRDFSPLLQAKGHKVTAPTLTGLGERIHLSSPEVGLETHVQDVVNHLFYEDLTDVVLVGHSYGGMVITGVADRVPERIKHLVFLDAFFPGNGQSVMDLNGGASGSAGGRPLNIDDGWKVVPQRPATAPGAPPPSEVELWRRDRIAPMPIHTMDQPAHYSLPLEERAFSRTYIKASADAAPPAGNGNAAFWLAAEYAKSSPAWSYFELPTTHNVQITMPNELAEILLGLG
jgi:pimeloyl-ACP methyl ester carboxylesterase